MKGKGKEGTNDADKKKTRKKKMNEGIKEKKRNE